ncbi:MULTISPECIES: DUF2231 domain-containing protein [unclassified Nocardioides]|uniref:DUF2231 domain-containing protein n=1 Tax=unclassified Nocardioides TaxID=2615069 RepID=UPI0009E7F796|nr:MULTISPECIES: DUF2231 domain-containing protein [unclassified Nocardioides]
MPSTMFGLPVHPLLVHATVVFVPLAVLLVVLAVCWPRFRAWAGPLPAGVSLVALVLTPLSTATGENLEHDLPHNALIERHAELGDQLLPFTIALFVLAAGFWWLTRTPRETAAPKRPWPPVLVTGVGVLAVLAAIGTGVQVARIGHSGAQAAWSDAGSSSGG